MTFGDQGRFDVLRFLRRKLELLELVDFRAGGIADPITSSVSAVVGRLMTHSLLRRIGPKLWLPLAITQPTRDGVNSITVCQPMVMMLRSSPCADVTSTIGPRFQIAPDL
jgi:hypothetical protein